MRGLLSVSFGTSHVDTRERTIDAVEAALKEAFPERTFFSAWTSPRIIAKTRERGEWHDSLDEAFARLDEEGVDDLIVSTMCLMHGEEMAKVTSAVHEWAVQGGRSVRLAEPVLSSAGDREAVARIICDEFSQVEDDESLLLMGHGSGTGDNSVYGDLQHIFHGFGRENFHVATVEGVPSFDDVLPTLEQSGARCVYLAPLMIVAGDHAKNDLAGSGENSWASQLAARGLQVQPVLKGLGEYPGIRELICDHVRDALTIREVALRG